MLYRCTESFETREGGAVATVDEGTVWYKTRHVHAFGGYEIAVMEEVDQGRFTGSMAFVRLYRLSTSFERIPPSQCVYPIGCSEFHDQQPTATS